MSCFAAVMRDVALARSLDLPFSRLAAESSLALGGLQNRLVTLCDPVPLQNGACTVRILLERTYASCRRSDGQLSRFLVHAEWDVLFGSSYPSEPCTWHFVEGRDTDVGTAAYRPTRLWPFVVEDLVTRMAAPSRLYTEACDGDAESNSLCCCISRDDVVHLPSPTRLRAANAFAGTSSGVEQKNGESTTATSRFILDFVFLCSWWTALELDDDSIMPLRDLGIRNTSFMGNVAALDEDTNSGFLRQGRCAQLMDDVGGNMLVQRPRRKFAAVFLPRGGVLTWGFLYDRGIMGKNRDMPGETAGDAEEEQLFRTAPSGMSSYRRSGGSGGLKRNYGNYLESLEVHGGHLPHDGAGKMLCVLYASHGARDGDTSSRVVLPSLLVSENILHAQLHQLGDICLYSDNPSVSLRRNARISRNAKALRSVSSAFRMLSHLMKGLSPYVPSLYAQHLVAPVLHEVVVEMQAQRQPFWAGVVICCIVLPAVLSDRQMKLNLAAHLMDPVESYRCVSLVARVFAIVGFPIKFREAELAKSAIQNAYYASKPSLPVDNKCWRGNGENSSSSTTTWITALPNHPPITECAVCGLPLLRNTSGGAGSGTASAATVSNIGCDGTAVMRFARDDKCLVVRCVRCGHGGHVAHIIAWWDDRSVRWCPKGCDCCCIY